MNIVFENIIIISDKGLIFKKKYYSGSGQQTLEKEILKYNNELEFIANLKDKEVSLFKFNKQTLIDLVKKHKVTAVLSLSAHVFGHDPKNSIDFIKFISELATKEKFIYINYAQPKK